MSEPAIEKRKRKRGGSDSIAETLAKWKEINKDGETRIRKAPAKGSKKGCMQGKGGPDNSCCNYRGVRQRTWGKWVAEIRAPNGGRRMWLGTFGTALEAAIAYDGAARSMYGACARVNLPECSSAAEVSVTTTSEESYDESTTTGSHHSFSNVSCPEAKVPNLGSGPPPSAAVVDAPCMVKADAEKDLSENSGHLEEEDMFVNIGRRWEDDDRFGYIEVEALIEEFGHLEDEEFEDLPENMFNFDYMSRGTDSDLGKGTAGSEGLDSDIRWPTLPPLQSWDELGEFCHLEEPTPPSSRLPSWDELGKLFRLEEPTPPSRLQSWDELGKLCHLEEPTPPSSRLPSWDELGKLCHLEEPTQLSSRLQSWDANEPGNLCHREPTPSSGHEFLGRTSMDLAYPLADCDFLRRWK